MASRFRSMLSWMGTVCCCVAALSATASLPAQAAAGRTAGSFSVSNVGSASYTIPIFVPPGVNGVQPSVALVYNSNGGPAYLGKGWQLSYGGSVLGRCNQTVAQDGKAMAVKLFPIDYVNDLDGYCLDGNRLRLQGGDYGASGSVYATEIADFSRITATDTTGNGPTSWTVERKDGLTYTYGGTSDSRVLGDGWSIWGPVSTVITWRLSQIEDRSGNKILFSYKSPDGTTAGITHPTAIHWTQTSFDSGEYVYSMEFAYGGGANALPSSPTGFVADNTVRDTDLLNSISVKESGTTVRKYLLDYEESPATFGKRLKSVTECSNAAANDCLAPTTITYQNGQAGIVSSPSYTFTGSGFGAAVGAYDYNGDGLLDVAYYRSGAWYVRFASISGYGSEYSIGVNGSLMAGDPFGNGRDVVMGFNGTSTWHAYIWNGSAFAPVNTGIAAYASAPIVSLADVDGDGRDDMVYVKGVSNGMIQMGTRPSTSTGSTLSFGSEVVSGMTPPPLGEGAYLEDGYVTTRLSDGDIWQLGDLDTNGDGRTDVLVDGSLLYCWGDPYYDCWPYEFSAALRPTYDVGPYHYHFGIIQFAVPDNLYPFYPANLNSDGCTDFIKRGGVNVSRSGCAGGDIGTNTYSTVMGVIDWDGDGRQDVLIGYGAYSTLHVQRSTGEGLAPPVDTGLPLSCHPFVTDANGDGLEDLGCWYWTYPSGAGSVEIHLHNGASVRPDLAVKFTDGYGIEHEVTYANSTHEGYTAGTSATYPRQDVKNNQVLVRSVEASDGRGGTYTRTYDYFGATRDVQGRGFQGFEKIESVDSRSGIKHVRKFRQDFPFTGMLVEESLYQPYNGPPISQKIITQTQHVLGSTAESEHYFPYVVSVIEDMYEVGGAKNGNLITRTQITNTVSLLGNLEGSIRVVTDKDSTSPFVDQTWTTVASATFNPNATYWCLGLPEATSVASSTSMSGESSWSVEREQDLTVDYVNCRHTATDVEPSGGSRRVQTSYGFDDFGNIESVTVIGRDENGDPMIARTSQIDWGSADGTVGGTGQFPVRERNALEQETSRTFHATFGSLLTETDPNTIVVVENTYDDFGRLERGERPDGTATDIEYHFCAVSGTYACENGDPGSGYGTNTMIVVATERDTGNDAIRDTWTYLDQFERTVVEKSRAASGAYSRSGSEYDIYGRLAKQSAPCVVGACDYYWVSNEYDLIGRIYQQSRPFSDSYSTPVTTTFLYEGRAQKVTDAEGKLTTRILDVNGWMRQSKDHYNYYQSFSYDAAGSLKQVTDSLSNTLFTATYSYGIRAFQDLTTDMDLGTWSYTYNSLGELVEWEDANSQSFSQTHDLLSRVTARTEPEGTTYFNWGNSEGAHNIGRLASATMSGYGEYFTYDNKGRVIERKISTDQDYFINYAYTDQGLLDTLTYPQSTDSTRVKIKYGYAHGILQSLTDLTSGSAVTTYWTADTQNARGQTTQQTLGNGVVTVRSFDAVTGWLNSIESGPSGGAGLQNHSYAYDNVGNVTQRQENMLALTENFHYDDLHRLSYSTLNSTTNLTVAYDDMGNITSKSDVGAYDYTTAQTGCSYYSHTQRHAVRSAGGAVYCYDANGNMTQRDGETISWSSFNYPTSLATATESTVFHYGPDRQYYKQEYFGPSGTEITHYVGGILEKVFDGTTEDWRHYIHAEGQVVAIVSRSGAGNAVYYPLGDNQGSGSHLTSSSGTSLVRQSHDAFGWYRDGADWDGAEQSGDLAIINGISRRGYTGHSMLGEMGLIHMNGRVHDAILGRFLSPDPYVPYPESTQSFNRYAYVRNNPLTFVDPSGFCDSYDWFGKFKECLNDLAEVVVRGYSNVCDGLEGQLQDLCLGLSDWVSSLSISQYNCLMYGRLACGSGEQLPIQNMNDALDARGTMAGSGGPLTRRVVRGVSRSQPQSEFGAHEAAELLWPGYDLGTCMSSRGDCDAGDWILGMVGVIPGGKGAALGAKGLFKGALELWPTAHSVQRKINRGVRSADEIDALKNPLSVGPVRVDDLGRPSQRYVGGNAEVVINPDTGAIVSVNPTSTKKAERLRRNQGGGE